MIRGIKKIDVEFVFFFFTQTALYFSDGEIKDIDVGCTCNSVDRHEM
jgi:hypothetical protein